MSAQEPAAPEGADDPVPPDSRGIVERGSTDWSAWLPITPDGGL